MPLALRTTGGSFESPVSRSPVVFTRPGETVTDPGHAGLFVSIGPRTVRRIAGNFPLPGRKLLLVEYDEADVVAAGTPHWSVSKLRVLREVDADEAARIAEGAPLTDSVLST